MFKCHSKSRKAVPAYRAHFRSLTYIFGIKEANVIVKKLLKARGDFYVNMDKRKYNILKDNDDTKKKQIPLFTRGQ